jgi:hypothetical protein
MSKYNEEERGTEEDLYERFWIGFRQYQEQSKTPFPFTYSDSRWVKRSLGRTGADLELRIVKKTRYIAAQIRLTGPDAPERFNDLLKRRAETESMIGLSLEWSDESSDNLRTITLRDDFDPREMDRWTWAYRWIIDQATVFYDVFEPFITSSHVQPSLSLTVAADGEVGAELASTARTMAKDGYFSPATLHDERERRLREIVQRRGQPEFRNELIVAYNGRCAVTGCDAIAALEAAHIVPYCGPDSNHVTNGLLLRSDIHVIFDLGLLGIQPEKLTIGLTPVLQSTSYAELHGKQLALPAISGIRPNKLALIQRWQEFRAQ